MSSETDHPRQITVAELLAAHGAGTVTGRRARRRAAEDATVARRVESGAAAGTYPATSGNGPDSGQAPKAATVDAAAGDHGASAATVGVAPYAADGGVSSYSASPGSPVNGAADASPPNGAPTI